ncbi:UPF0496 protein At3g19330-like [Nicotiana sylvestris]|uniref:UPF0496 protein At3g19330-like n=1 Tax=Nicotiana sylvestris TaxID=4096 RepID=A0A1U7VKG1_NICSY|nr:PREDICTED: UPF0496 protein At3g19330-like [Nicotiana sylvestris]XP_009765446.1 PREDICTED: UPF0496 protein At3g19330-like [Nicotiana sylvestris]
MLHCLRQLSLTATTDSSPPALEGGLVEDNTANSQPSPTVNLSRAYTLAVQTSSYGEIWSKVHHEVPSDLSVEVAQVEFQEEPLQLEDVLKPSHECVQEALLHIIPDALNQLIAKYFDDSEQTTRICILFSQSVNQARVLYAPIHKLLDVLPLDMESAGHSLSQAQCDWAFDIFLQFDSLTNPFPGHDTHNFDDMRHCYFQLKSELDLLLRKSRSKVQLLRHATRGSVVCLVAATVGVVISAVAIATHAFVALVAAPICPAFLPSKMAKKELVHLVQMDDATKGIFFLHNHLETVNCLVGRLYDAVEYYKRLVRFALERGKDRYPIQEVVKQLHGKHSNFLEELLGLEEHLCLCFAAINKARGHLLSYLLRQNQVPG